MHNEAKNLVEVSRRKKWHINFFNHLKPSEYINITIFGLELLEFFVNHNTYGWTISVTILGLKIQIDKEEK